MRVEQKVSSEKSILFPDILSRQLAIAKSHIKFYAANQIINIVSPGDSELLSRERA